MADLSQLSDEQLDAYRGLLMQKQAPEHPGPARPPLPLGLQQGSNLRERLTNKPAPHPLGENLVPTQEIPEGVLDIAGGHPFRGAARIATPFLLAAPGAEVGAAMRLPGELQSPITMRPPEWKPPSHLRTVLRSGAEFTPFPLRPILRAAADRMPAEPTPTGPLSRIQLRSPFPSEPRVPLWQNRMSIVEPEAHGSPAFEPIPGSLPSGRSPNNPSARIGRTLEAEPPQPNPVRQAAAEARLKLSNPPAESRSTDIEPIRAPLPSGRQVGTGQPRISVDTSKAAAPNEPALLEDLSKSLAGKSYGKLRPEQQQAVRDTAARIQAPNVQGPALAQKPQEIAAKMNEAMGLPPKLTTLESPARPGTAAPEAYAAGARSKRMDTADAVAGHLKSGKVTGIHGPEDIPGVVRALGHDWPTTPKAQVKLLTDILERLK